MLVSLLQRYSFKRHSSPHCIPSLDISQYSESGSYIVTELDSEPLRRDLSQYLNDDDGRFHCANKIHANKNDFVSQMTSSISNLSSKTLPNGSIGTQSPTKSTNIHLNKEVHNPFTVLPYVRMIFP